MTKSLSNQIRSVLAGETSTEPVRESLASAIRNMGKKPVAIVESKPEGDGIIDTTVVAVPQELVYESSLEEIDESIPTPTFVMPPQSPPVRQMTVEEEILGEMASTITAPVMSRPRTVAPAMINSKPTLPTRRPVAAPVVVKEEAMPLRAGIPMKQFTVPEPVTGPKYKSVAEYRQAMQNKRAQIQRKIIDNP